ncbi:MAG: hypothetical protein JWR34_4801 [Mycobacterium sp.]|nr:hypothetical protein [Mycobacterium sp.]
MAELVGISTVRYYKRVDGVILNSTAFCRQ